jgi:2-phospho-L-lactate guanylyltransferase
MFETVARAAENVPAVDAIVVVTSYQPAMDFARKKGFDVIVEEEQVSESTSVDFASRELRADGATAVLRLPADLPLITKEDIEEIFAHEKSSPSCVIVPSRDGTGTNALIRRPPTLFKSFFGPGSLEKHKSAAKRAGAKLVVVELPRVALDIDAPEDIEELRIVGPDSPAYQLLERFGKG